MFVRGEEKRERRRRGVKRERRKEGKRREKNKKKYGNVC
jgi:hypothetical protein